MLLKCVQITIELRVILNFILQQLVSGTILTGKFAFYHRVSKSVTCVALVRKARQEPHLDQDTGYPD
jgi:hypothetical protein